MTGTTPGRPRLDSNSQPIPRSILFGDSPRTRRMSVSVQFGHVEIHEFGPAIGHNPSVTAGVPITLSDRPIKSSSIDLGDFEQRRMGQRRSTRQLHIPKEIREQMCVDPSSDGSSLPSLRIRLAADCVQSSLTLAFIYLGYWRKDFRNGRLSMLFEQLASLVPIGSNRTTVGPLRKRLKKRARS